MKRILPIVFLVVHGIGVYVVKPIAKTTFHVVHFVVK